MNPQRTYDTYVPTALASASLGRRRVPIAGQRAEWGDEQPTDDLEKSYVQWNVRIDKEVKAVVEGLGDLVKLADLGTPAPGAHTLSALHLKLRTSSLIRAAQQLRDTAHELSLSLALGDDVGAAVRRDQEAAELKAEVERLRREIAVEVGRQGGGSAVGEEVEGGASGSSGEEVEGEKESEAKGETKGETKEDTQEGTEGEAQAALDEGMEVDDDEDEFEEV